MILEGFEIENWSCIRRLAVDDLPPTGAIVLHGPNGTGKSSIVAALRACLMDYPATSSSKDLRRWFPKNSSEKPRVSVTFRTQGTSWRISKQFGGRESTLESRTAGGAWKLEKSTAADAHEECRLLVGGKDSDAGLHQLLWLTQAEFKLPDPKDFDGDIQSRLRAVLGVLQTPLDDQFLARVKDGWSQWFGARRKPGEESRLKKDCPLEKAIALLEQQKTALATVEVEYRAFERMMEKSGDLEVLSRDLRRQQIDRTRERDLLQQEYEKSLIRLNAFRIAADHVDVVDKALHDQQALRLRRADVQQRVGEAEKSAEAERREVDESNRRLEAAEQSLRQRRREVHELAIATRALQGRIDESNERRQLLNLKEQIRVAREIAQQAGRIAGELDEMRKQARERPAPDVRTLKALEDNRSSAGRLRAELEAAAISLTLVIDPGSAPPELAIDGVPPAPGAKSPDGAPIHYSIRRRAELSIPGWGRAELNRGSDSRSLDQIEIELTELDRNFARDIATFGIAAGDPSALDHLRGLAAEKKSRDPELKRREAELTRLAPDGLDKLHEKFAALEKRHQAAEAELALRPASANTLADAADMERLERELKNEKTGNEKTVAAHQKEIESLELEIDGFPQAGGGGSRRSTGAEAKNPAMSGLRQRAAVARERLAALAAMVTALQNEVVRFPTVQEIETAIGKATAALDLARQELEAAKLSEGEETIRERLDTAKDTLQIIQNQLTDAEREYNEIKGQLRSSEGLHQRRAAAAGRVDQLLRQTQREQMDSEAFDRLYALFEECREKQLGAVMGPIHDRVLRWMRLLRIGGYESIRFNDQFLPDKLVVAGGAAELSLGEESTGTIEQIALMVRLALGSMLSTQQEPAVAVLDDPLTHSDVIRLNSMRAVLKHASAGDLSSTPPAGPLQIVIFTCHPEWFAVDGAKIIDLSKPDLLSRSS